MGSEFELKARLKSFACRERSREPYFLLAISSTVGVFGLVLSLILVKSWAVLVVLPAVGFLIYRAAAPLDLKGTARRLKRDSQGVS